MHENGEFPSHWQLNQVDNVVPDLIVDANPGNIFIDEHYQTAATHGFDVGKTNTMEAVFLAYGQDIKPGRMDKFRNIHVFSLIAHLTGIEVTDERASDLSIFNAYLK